MPTLLSSSPSLSIMGGMGRQRLQKAIWWAGRRPVTVSQMNFESQSRYSVFECEAEDSASGGDWQLKPQKASCPLSHFCIRRG
jgi:hypothetical protein